MDLVLGTPDPPHLRAMLSVRRIDEYIPYMPDQILGTVHHHRVPAGGQFGGGGRAPAARRGSGRPPRATRRNVAAGRWSSRTSRTPGTRPGGEASGDEPGHRRLPRTGGPVNTRTDAVDTTTTVAPGRTGSGGASVRRPRLTTGCRGAVVPLRLRGRARQAGRSQAKGHPRGDGPHLCLVALVPSMSRSGSHHLHQVRRGYGLAKTIEDDGTEPLPYLRLLEVTEPREDDNG